MKLLNHAWIFGVLFLGLCNPALARTELPSPGWDRELALETAMRTDIGGELGQLFALARERQDEALLQQLAQLELDDALSIPTRELLLYRFTQGLGDLAPGAVGDPVLDYLADYRVRTLVPHEERPSAGVPLFNIPSAARGVLNSWERREAQTRAARALGAPATQWVDAFALAGPQARKGFLDALEYASPLQLSHIGTEAAGRLSTEPGLSLLAGRSALLGGDQHLLEHVLISGGGSGLAALFRAIPDAFSSAQSLRLLQTAIEHASPEIATLAIAGIGPRLVSDPAGFELLQSASEDSRLGPAIRLALTTKKTASHAPTAIATEAGENARISEWVEDAPSSDDTKIALGYPVPIPVDTPLPFDGFRSYAGLHMRHQEFMHQTEWAHGYVLKQTHAGRDVWAYRLGDEDLLTIEGMPEQAMLTNGGIHAREWQTPEVVTGIMELLVGQQDDQFLYSYLRDNVNAIVIPVLNVDGFLQTQRFPSQNWMGTDPNDPEFSPRDGRMRRKNMLMADEDLFTQEDHLNGVDLNRNNNPYWSTRSGSRSSPNLNSIVHHGAGPASEPETQALDAAAHLGPIEQLSMYTDVHSFSQVHFWGRNDNDRLAILTQKLLSTFTGHHAGFPAAKFYGFGSHLSVPRNQGIGTTDEYFTHTYQVPSWTLEVEPNNGGADYGGLHRNGHDGFILPESEIKRVRTEMAQTFAIAYYRQSGPPAMKALRLIDEATGAVVFKADWVRSGSTGRSLHTYQAQPLQLEREYRIWSAWNKPMRWRENGEVVALAGQPGHTLELDAGLRVGDVSLTAILNDAGWLDQAGEAPGGYLNYRDDAMFADFRMPSNANNQSLIGGEATASLEMEVSDMTGQLTDADPSTVARWEDGGWTGYEDSDGNDLTDTGGTDSSISLAITTQDLGDPFLIEAGTSAAWYDPARNGEGFVLEILSADQALMYWFTYDARGNQDWFISMGEIRGNRIVFPELLQVSGGEFGPGFDPSMVSETVVGSASFIWSECDHGAMDWTLRGEDGRVSHGRMNLQRLSNLMGVDCGREAPPPDRGEALLSGSWYDPSHAGEGYTLEVLADGRVLVYWFSFDTEGQRRWFFGVGEIVQGKLVFVEMFTTRNGIFGPGFDPGMVEESPWGSLELDISCDGGTASFSPTESGFPAGTLELERLTSLHLLDC
jgi:hypothetical protein